MITLEEMKKYLRIDFDDDNDLIENLIESSKKMCVDIARIKYEDIFENERYLKIAIMYAVAYMYEHREESNYNELMISLRAILSNVRREEF